MRSASKVEAAYKREERRVLPSKHQRVAGYWPKTQRQVGGKAEPRTHEPQRRKADGFIADEQHEYSIREKENAQDLTAKTVL